MDKLLSNYGTIENASRISRPPGMGLAYENLGTSLAPPGTNKSKKPILSTTGIQGSYSKFRPATSTKSSSSQPTPSSSQKSLRGKFDSTSRTAIRRNPSKGVVVLDDSGSPDELDFLSSQAEEEEEGDLYDMKKKKRGQSQGKKAKDVFEPAFMDEQGNQHAYDPKFPPKKQFAGLKFTKNKKAEQAADSSLVPSSKESEKEQYLEQISTRASYPNKDTAKSTATTSKTTDYDEDVVYVRPLSGKSANSNRRTSPIPSRIHKKLPSNTPQPRPVPHPKNGGRHGSASFLLNSQPKSTCEPRSSQTNPPSSSAAPLNMMPVDTSSQTSVALERYRTWSESPERSEQKAEPDDFPSLSPPSSHASRKQKQITVDDFPFVSPLSGTKIRAEPIKRHASSSRMPVPFPMPSPQSKTNGKPKTKPYIQAKDKGKGKSKVQISEEEDEGDLEASEKRKREKKARKLEKKAEAFPMSTQVLASMRSPSVPPTWSSSPAGPSRSGKRTSEGGSDDERISKRSRTQRDAYVSFPFQHFSFSLMVSIWLRLLLSPARILFDDEGDSSKKPLHLTQITLFTIFSSIHFSSCRPKNPLSILRHTSTIQPITPPPEHFGYYTEEIST